MAPSQEPLMDPPFAMAPPMVADVPVFSRRCWRSMMCGQEGVGEEHGGSYGHNQQLPRRMLIMSFITSFDCCQMHFECMCHTRAHIICGSHLHSIYKMNKVDIF